MEPNFNYPREWKHDKPARTVSLATIGWALVILGALVLAGWLVVRM